MTDVPVNAGTQSSSVEPSLHRVMGPWLLLLFIVGDILGTGIYALWDDPADDAANRAWVRTVDVALAPFRTGRYVGEADLTLGPERRAECFGFGTEVSIERPGSDTRPFRDAIDTGQIEALFTEAAAGCG